MADGEPEAILGTDFMLRCPKCTSVDVIQHPPNMMDAAKNCSAYECRTCGCEWDVNNIGKRFTNG